jgi:hypothetical protein
MCSFFVYFPSFCFITLLVYNMPFPMYTSGGLLLLTAPGKWCTQMLVNASGDIMSGLKQKTWTTGGQ